MNFKKTFSIEKEKTAKIPGFFKTLGYTLELGLPDYYRFRRGSQWIAPLTPDIKYLPTWVDVKFTEKEDDTVQVLVLYEIDTMGRVIPRNQQDKIKAELDNL